LEGGDEEAADEAEDQDVALHDGVVKQYIHSSHAENNSASAPPRHRFILLNAHPAA
jgi:hypothetical protein